MVNRNGKGRKNSPEEKLQGMMISALNNAAVYADGADFQTGATSYRHAISNGETFQTVDDAMNQADAFVRNQFVKAKQLLAKGKTYDAYFAFGLHALQDATSPAHAGFKTWYDSPGAIRIVSHVSKELYYPGTNSNLQKVTNTYLAWFQKSNSPLPKTNLFKAIKSD